MLIVLAGVHLVEGWLGGEGPGYLAAERLGQRWGGDEVPPGDPHPGHPHHHAQHQNMEGNGRGEAQWEGGQVHRSGPRRPTQIVPHYGGSHFLFSLYWTFICIFLPAIMHARLPGRHIVIDSQLLILSFDWKFFVCRHVSMWEFQNRVCLSVHREKKSPWLCQYQSYISNRYINGKVFTSTTAWKPKNLILLSDFLDG